MEKKTVGTALLVMDMQTGILGMLPDSTAIVEKVSNAISIARKKNMPVIYVVVGFRDGCPEISEHSNKSFAMGKDRFSQMNMEDFMKIHPDLAPLDGEVTVVKRRVSAFTGSDLEVLLRSFGIGHMVLTGIATSGVVLSTLREAADKDFQLTVLSDCCIDRDPEVHDVLTTKVFPGQAAVLTADEWDRQ